MEIVNSIVNTPIPTIFIIFGIVLILIAIGVQSQTRIITTSVKPITAGIMGGLFLISGLLLHVSPILFTDTSASDAAIEFKLKKDIKVVYTTEPLKKIRYGYNYVFPYQLTAGEYKLEAWDVGKSTLNEDLNFNNGPNPNFVPTKELTAHKNKNKSEGFVLLPGELLTVVTQDMSYEISKVGAGEKSYITKIHEIYLRQYINNSWAPWYRSVAIQALKVTWCGDGVIDNFEDPVAGIVAEQCDPGTKDSSAKTCSNSCNLLK